MIRQKGFILLDVVLSIALLLVGLTFIGAQVNKAQESAYKSEDLTRVLMLAETKLAELGTGLVPFDQEADDEIEGDFTLRFPDYGWRMQVTETATEGLRAVTLQILYRPRESLDDEFDFDNAEVVYQAHTMRADPPILDVETDLGLDEETIIQLTETLPSEYFDPPYFDPQILTQLDMDELTELLPSLISLLGSNAESLLASLPPQFRAMLELETGDQSPGSGETGASTGASTEVTDEDLGLFDMSRDELGELEEVQQQSGRRSGGQGGRR